MIGAGQHSAGQRLVAQTIGSIGRVRVEDPSRRVISSHRAANTCLVGRDVSRCLMLETDLQLREFNTGTPSHNVHNGAKSAPAGYNHRRIWKGENVLDQRQLPAVFFDPILDHSGENAEDLSSPSLVNSYSAARATFWTNRVEAAV